MGPGSTIISLCLPLSRQNISLSPFLYRVSKHVPLAGLNSKYVAVHSVSMTIAAALTAAFNTSNTALLTLGSIDVAHVGYTSAIYFGLTNLYYLFDSHNRDATGISAHNGVTIMLTFRNLTGLQQYLIRLATALNLSGGMFEKVPISIKLNKSVTLQKGNIVTDHKGY